MKLQLVTLSGTKLNEEVYEVILPTADGEIAVFPDHEELVSMAVPGVISVRRSKGQPDEDMELFAISGGVIEVNGGLVRVLVDDADSSEEIVEAEVQAALARAEQMRDSAVDEVELEKAHQLVDRYAVRLKVAGLRRRRRNS